MSILEALRGRATANYFAIRLYHRNTTNSSKLLKDGSGRVLVWTEESVLQETLRQMIMEANYEGDWNKCYSVTSYVDRERYIISDLVKLKYYGIDNYYGYHNINIK
jgi:hypothetical protein